MNALQDLVDQMAGPNPAPDSVTLEDYDEATVILRGNLNGIDQYGDRVGPLGQEWLEHAILHVRRKANAYLRDGSVPQDQAQFMAYIKTMAQGYQVGAKALHVAAERLNRHGDSVGARVTMTASIEMARKAHDLTGE